MKSLIGTPISCQLNGLDDTAAPVRPHLVLFPGALGDFLCFLPVAETLRRQSRTALTLVTKIAYRDLLESDHFRVVDIDRRETAALFAPPAPGNRIHLGMFTGFARVLSWTGSRDPNLARNLQSVTDGEVELHDFNGFRSGIHATEYFAACAGVHATDPVFPLGATARGWATAQIDKLDNGRVLVVHGGSGSERKNWRGMAELVRHWRAGGGRAICLVGPADSAVEGCDLTVQQQPLDHVAAILAATRLYVGNDSGISHLAAAVGCRGFALFGDTDPSIWRPRGTNVRVIRAAPECRICGPDRLCTHRIRVDSVLKKVDRLCRESYRRRR